MLSTNLGPTKPFKDETATLEKSSSSWYNPMLIGGYGVNKIEIMDTDNTTVLYSFSWFKKFKTSNNSTNTPIVLLDKLVKSDHVKNRLRLVGTAGEHTLKIHCSLLEIIELDSVINECEYRNSETTYYKLAGEEAYFSTREPLPQTPKQLAYAEMYDLLDNERISSADLKNALRFYKENKELCNKAGITC